MRTINKILKLKYAQTSGPTRCLGKKSLYNNLSVIMGKFATPPFDGKAYHNEYLTLASVSATGSMVALTFKEGYLPDGYVSMSNVTVSGTLA